ncbi:lipid particle protein [Cryptococcus deuterogattii 99/473]|uniref:Lipid particle protein n=1 Tax=Cryptococcus deuterogattii Ram5 TaxID=1296110 RepID=A0A0D0T8I8_9TREE|nr:lipid particle protein [Cryptococcus deuterogattii Ram5]KIR72858.1 lipid particle protein [Cryptococcus deuterogattii CA1014]KIS00517.1 lipid particle protein [Cryptococcus deuterogattii 2001/935-1]KIY59721.1 lipid particle protein [Cryptococcus deuterogattii 99/473]
MSSLIPSPTSFLNATAALIAPSPISKSQSPLTPAEGAPLSGDTTLIPNKYLSEKRDEDAGYPPSPLKTKSEAQTTSLNPHPSRSVPQEIPSLVRSPPSTLLDAPARAAMSLPNGQTAAAQARAVRGGEVKTPEYEVDEDGYSRAEDVPLLAAPNPIRPSLSRASSAASTASNRGILRRIFIDRSSTPSQHLTRPTFPPPSLSTYTPMSPTPLSLWAKLNLLFIQTVSVILSTYFLILVVLWAVAAELAKWLPKWIWPDRPRKFPWDDEEYWKKEGRTVSKDPAFYAKQVGMDIEHQTVETDDGYYLKELAMYDLPALVEHVCRETGYDKIAFIGHSQGNGLAFISLSLGMCPSLGSKLSVFIALAPAVYAGTLTTGFPFTTLNKMDWPTWKRFFGVLDFIPLMRWAYDYAPPSMFASLGYIMFAFLFSWTDTNWLHRRKTKMFRFTPTPVSSASIFWWCGKGGFADRKCTLDDSLPRWFDKRFPPLSIYHGGRDFLVFADPLLRRLKEKEKDVKVIKVTKLEDSEHCDFYWAAEAVEWAYLSFLDDIENTRPRYPDEPEFPEGGTETDLS